MDLLHPLREFRRHSLLAEPILPDWQVAVARNVAHFVRLSPSEQSRLLDDARVFVAEKSWEGGGGFVVTDEMKFTIAAQACLLVLGWDDARRTDLYPNVNAIIVYESGFRGGGKRVEGWVHVDSPVLYNLGESWSTNLPVILSWESSLSGGQSDDDGHNVVLHEFAHKLDTLSGGADGVPPLENAEAVEEWADAFSAAYAALRHDAEHSRDSLLDHYGATNEAEFFAVATETFFERPIEMKAEMPQLYDALRHFYDQDTAARFAPR